MESWFEELKNNVNDFLKNSTPEEIIKSLKESGYEHYKNIDKPIIDAHVARYNNKAIFWYNTDASEKSLNYSNRIVYEQSVPKIAAGEYNYELAA